MRLYTDGLLGFLQSTSSDLLPASAAHHRINTKFQSESVNFIFNLKSNVSGSDFLNDGYIKTVKTGPTFMYRETYLPNFVSLFTQRLP